MKVRRSVEAMAVKCLFPVREQGGAHLPPRTEGRTELNVYTNNYSAHPNARDRGRDVRVPSVIRRANGRNGVMKYGDVLETAALDYVPRIALLREIHPDRRR